MTSDLIFYEFSRSKVERLDFHHFLELYTPDKLPTGRRLRDMMNSFVFCVEGWDDGPREIQTIPEIRGFYFAFHEAWPYWLFFCNLQEDALMAMTMCCLVSVNTLQVDGQVQAAVTFDPLEMVAFLEKDLVPMNRMCEGAEMFEDRIYARTKALFEYFRLPFNPN